jgi:hypothetical protein
VERQARFEAVYAGTGSEPPPPQPSHEHSALLDRARALLDMAGLRGAVMVLAHTGHGNYLGLQSSLTEDSAPGHDFRADHEALFMQVAAIGTTATLLGSTVAVPELWPTEVPQEQFLQHAVDLTAGITNAAVVIHRLGTKRRAVPKAKKKTPAPRERGLLRPGAVLTAGDLLPDVNSADAVIVAAEEYYRFARVQGQTISPWDHGQAALHTMLAFAGGHSNLQAVMSTYDEPGSGVLSVFAARMLLEEAARLLWRFSIPREAGFKARAKQYFDEYRARRKKTIDMLVGSGVARADAERIVELPSNVQVVTPHDEIAKGRERLPSISSLLRAMGKPYEEPGWLDVAYSLLSQITHSTPIGHMHTMRVRYGIWPGWRRTHPGDARPRPGHRMPGQRPPHRPVGSDHDEHERRSARIPSGTQAKSWPGCTARYSSSTVSTDRFATSEMTEDAARLFQRRARSRSRCMADGT